MIYRTENATQRGNHSGSIAGTVAGAIRIVAKQVLTGLSGKPENLGNLTSAKGIGEPIVTKFLYDVPGMAKNVVLQQIANLKASGDYARIIGEVEK